MSSSQLYSQKPFQKILLIWPLLVIVFEVADIPLKPSSVYFGSLYSTGLFQQPVKQFLSITEALSPKHESVVGPHSV